MSDLISVIIPIYNAEKYIKNCIESVCKQTYRNLEILCINDGSSDNSLSVLKELNDSRINIITKQNSGVSDTRNYGINISNGKYVTFLDADDFLDENYIEVMYNALKETNSELAVSGYKEICNGKTIKKSIFENKIENNFDITYPSHLNYYLATFEFNPCWKQLIKKDLLIDNKVLFDKEVKYGEDFLFSIQCYKYSKKTTYVKNYGYNYFKNNDSVMNNIKIDALLKYAKDNKSIHEYILGNFELNHQYEQLLIKKTLRIYYGIEYKIVKSGVNYKTFKKYTEDIRKIYLDELKKNKINGNINENLNYCLLKYKLYLVFYLIKKIK